jgi:hypothetical protein
VSTCSQLHTFVLTLCVVALFVGQAFGSKAAYFCACGGTSVPTLSSHCHGPHGEHCHGGEAPATATHEEEDGGSRRDHELVDDEVPARLLEAAKPFVAPPALLALLPLVPVSRGAWDAESRAGRDVAVDGSPPPGVAVARTVVLLI